MKSLGVLITNFALRERTGTEVYAFDLARGLQAQGHAPVLYSPRPGPLAEKIRRETVPVVDDLDRLHAPPDIIHGQHADETVTALLRFPSAPAVYVCHDWYFAKDAPPRFPRVLRYVAVDSACRDKLLYEHGVLEGRVSVLLRFVDLEKFRPRAPLPPAARRGGARPARPRVRRALRVGHRRARRRRLARRGGGGARPPPTCARSRYRRGGSTTRFTTRPTGSGRGRTRSTSARSPSCHSPR